VTPARARTYWIWLRRDSALWRVAVACLMGLLALPILVLAVGVGLDSGSQALPVGLATLLAPMALWYAFVLLQRRGLAVPSGKTYRSLATSVFALVVLMATYTPWVFLVAVCFASSFILWLNWREVGTGSETALEHMVPTPVVGGALLGCALHWLIDATVFLTNPAFLRQVDFSIYYAAAVALSRNPSADIYHLSVLQSAARLQPGALMPQFPYLYPPLFAELLRPLSYMSAQFAATIWIVLNLACWLACVALLTAWMALAVAPEARPQATAWPKTPAGAMRWACSWWHALPAGGKVAVCATACAGLTYEPLRHVVVLGQTSSFVLICILGIPLLAKRGALSAAGVALALAVVLKILPVLLITYFAAIRNWRVVAITLLCIAAATVTTAALGVPVAEMMQGVLRNTGVQESLFNNMSLLHAPTWTAAEFGGGPSALALAAGYGLIACVGTVFVGAMTLFWRWPKEATSRLMPADGDAGWLGYGYAAATLTLVSPVTWQHYDVWLLPAAVWCLGLCIRLVSQRKRNREGHSFLELYAICALVTGYVLTMDALPFNLDSVSAFSIVPLVAGVPLRPLLMLLRPLGAVLVWTTAGLLLYRALRVPGVSANSSVQAS
jgi:Glycosyltransferase family 87